MCVCVYSSIYFAVSLDDANHGALLFLSQMLLQYCSICMDNYWCESGYCRDNVCIRDPDSTNEQKLIGEECDEKNNHRDCKSGFCLKGHCQDHPVVCPVNENVSDAYPEPKINYEKFSGYRLDPYCRTEARWCEFNDLSLVGSGCIGPVLLSFG